MPSHFQIQQLYQRIAAQYRDIRYLRRRVPTQIERLITKAELQNIYSYLTTRKTYLTCRLQQTFPLRLDKTESKLARTLTFIEDPITNEIYLILETKSKTVNGKNFSLPAISGTFKKVKSAWRIDVPIPQQFANAVTYIETESDVLSPNTELALSHKIHHPTFHHFVNLILDGRCFLKIEQPPNMDLPKDTHCFMLYKNKMSLYSKWANQGNMHELIYDKPLLGMLEINRLITQLLLAIKAFHDKNLIHQDIKPNNILIFENEKGERTLKLNDFALGYDPENPSENNIPLASFSYASPELVAAHYYYHQNPGFDYEYFLLQTTNYQLFLWPDANQLPALKPYELFVKKEGQKLKYRCLDIKNIKNKIEDTLDIDLQDEILTEAKLQELKKAILEITFSRGHTLKEFPSYGKMLFFQNKNKYKAKMEKDPTIFCMPDKSNDIWAVGITLYELFNNGFPFKDSEFNFTRLIAGLLNPDRELRLTADQALLFHYMNTNQYDEAKKFLDATPSLASFAEASQFESCLKQFEKMNIHSPKMV